MMINCMQSVFVKAVFDLDCEWKTQTPCYRIYVNDELFAERTWRWTKEYLEEILQIQAPPGRYHVKIQSLDQDSKFTAKNHRIEHGRAQWIDNEILEIVS